METIEVPFKNTFKLHLENYEPCRNGDLRFDVVLTENTDGDHEFLRLVGTRWSPKLKRILPPADMLRRPHPKTGQPTYWDHWKHGDKFKRAVLMILEREGYIGKAPGAPIVAAGIH